MSDPLLRLVTERDENVNWLHGTIVDDSQEYPYSQIATLSHDLDWEGNMAIALVLVASTKLLAACEAAAITLKAAGNVMEHRGFNPSPIRDTLAKITAAIDQAKGDE